MSRLSEQKKQLIREVFYQTGSLRATAKQTGVSRNAIRRELCPKNQPGIRQAGPKGSKLDPFKSKIEFLVREKDLNGVRILEEIKELGYQGGYSILKDYLRTIRQKPRKVPRPPIDHPPGHEAQMDWSPHRVILGGRQQTVHTGSLVLCFSRWMFLRFFVDEKIESVISLHEQAFGELGAVPQTITYDNMTTVGRHTGPGKVWINPVFQSFAKGYGFKVVVLPPGKKERHGIVERPFYYVETNFLKGREFQDLEDLNSRGDLWRAQTANVRMHGTLKERPVDRLDREMSYLRPLPHNLSDQAYKECDRVVHTDFCVGLDTNRYSVDPELIGQWVKLRLYKDRLEIWFGKQLHCRHTYAQGRNKRQILPEHEQEYKKTSGQKQLLESAFLRLGEAARAYYLGLEEEKKAAAGYHLQRILKLADRYGPDVVCGALNYAAKYGAYSADAVFRILQGGKLRPQHNEQVMPDNIRSWLQGQAVERYDLRHYDQLLHSREDEDE